MPPVRTREIVRQQRKPLNFNEIVGERLRELRERAGLTQADVARALGTNQSNVSSTERGARGITARRLARISQILKASPADILGDAHLDDGLGSIAAAPSWARRLRQIGSLPSKKREALAQMIDAFLKAYVKD
jgi:transcriptional regulator with XRE-family HTH domain